MFIGSCVMYLSAEWVTSLKEKRMVVKSIIEKAKHKFNISIAEIDKQDIHQSIVIGFVCISNEKKHAGQMLQKVQEFIENNTDAVVDNIEEEIF